MLNRGAGDIIGTAQMHLDHRVPVFIRHLVEHAVAQDTGGIDHRMQPTKRIHSLFDHGLDAVHRTDAIGIGNGLTAHGADLGCDLFGGASRAQIIAADGCAQIIDDDAGTFLGRKQRTFTANAAATAGYQDHLAVKYAHHPAPEVFCCSALN